MAGVNICTIKSSFYFDKILSEYIIKLNYMKDVDEFNDSFLYQNVLSQQKVNYKMNLYRPASLQ